MVPPKFQNAESCSQGHCTSCDSFGHVLQTVIQLCQVGLLCKSWQVSNFEHHLGGMHRNSVLDGCCLEYWVQSGCAIQSMHASVQGLPASAEFSLHVCILLM